MKIDNFQPIKSYLANVAKEFLDVPDNKQEDLIFHLYNEIQSLGAGYLPTINGDSITLRTPFYSNSTIYIWDDPSNPPVMNQKTYNIVLATRKDAAEAYAVARQDSLYYTYIYGDYMATNLPHPPKESIALGIDLLLGEAGPHRILANAVAKEVVARKHHTFSLCSSREVDIEKTKKAILRKMHILGDDVSVDIEETSTTRWLTVVCDSYSLVVLFFKKGVINKLTAEALKKLSERIEKHEALPNRKFYVIFPDEKPSKQVVSALSGHYHNGALIDEKVRRVNLFYPLAWPDCKHIWFDNYTVKEATLEFDDICPDSEKGLDSPHPVNPQPKIVTEMDEPVKTVKRVRPNLDNDEEEPIVVTSTFRVLELEDKQ